MHANAIPATPPAARATLNPNGIPQKGNAYAPAASMKLTAFAALQGKFRWTAKNAFMNMCRKGSMSAYWQTATTLIAL